MITCLKFLVKSRSCSPLWTLRPSLIGLETRAPRTKISQSEISCDSVVSIGSSDSNHSIVWECIKEWSLSDRADIFPLWKKDQLINFCEWGRLENSSAIYICHVPSTNQSYTFTYSRLMHNQVIIMDWSVPLKEGENTYSTYRIKCCHNISHSISRFICCPSFPYLITIFTKFFFLIRGYIKVFHVNYIRW